MPPEPKPVSLEEFERQVGLAQRLGLQPFGTKRELLDAVANCRTPEARLEMIRRIAVTNFATVPDPLALS